MFERALYYPAIDIKNDRWLKSAVLFWDRIETIVPESIDEPYKRKLTRQLADEEILFPHYVNPFCEDVAGIEQDVAKYLQTKEGKQSFNQPWARSVAKKRTLEDNDFGTEEAFMNRIRNEYEEFYIHVQKLPQMLQEQLKEHQNENGFVWAREGFMSFYMTLLANRICQSGNMALLTDRVNQNKLSNKIMIEGLTPRRRNETDSLKSGLMYKIIMDDIKIDSSTPIEKIIRYKRDRQQNLQRFREELDNLINFSVEGMEVNDIENEVKTIYERQVLPAIDDIKATLKDGKIDWVIGQASNYVLCGIIPAVITSDLNMTKMVALAGSLGMAFAVSAVSYARNLWRQENRNPYTYLLKMDKRFSLGGRRR